jgi:hypothetical protein
MAKVHIKSRKKRKLSQSRLMKLSQSITNLFRRAPGPWKKKPKFHPRAPILRENEVCVTVAMQETTGTQIVQCLCLRHLKNVYHLLTRPIGAPISSAQTIIKENAYRKGGVHLAKASITNCCISFIRSQTKILQPRKRLTCV